MPTPLLDHVSPVDDTMLDGDHEAELLDHTGARGILCPFGAKSYADIPVVLIHGLDGAPDDLETLGGYVAGRPGLRPWYFLYDDEHSYLDRTAVGLARFIDELSQKNVSTIAIVAHSMGGVVARCALNFLADKRWFRDPGTDSYWGDVLPDHPAQQLTALRLLAVDVPWHGYLGPASDRGPDVEERSWHDMVRNGPVFQALYGVDLPAHVRVELVSANNHDWGAGHMFDPRCFAELSDNALDAIVALFEGDAGPLDAFPGASFMIDALMDDADFPQTYSELEAAVVAGTLDRDELLDILSKAVPPVPGGHTSVLDHHWLWHHLEALLT